MKQISLLSIVILSSLFVKAQSQRFEIIEEFTGENCPPCAAYNPGFDAILQANTSKIAVLKYECNIPTPGPVLYAETKTDVDRRQGYYNVPFAPWCTLDGNKFNNNVGNFYSSLIDDESSVTSPFDITLNHSISSDGDSVFITMVVTANQDVSTTGLFKAQIALVEKEIDFPTAYGYNGEKHFYMVMRKMYPNAIGTGMSTSWTKGQSQTIDISAPIPSYIYKKSELAVLGFVQDNYDKSIKQGAFSSYPLGIEKVNPISVISLYPNPASSSTDLSISLIENSDVNISITNLLGEVVYSIKNRVSSGNHNFDLDVASLSLGIYNVNILTDKERMNKKMVIVK